MSNANLSSGRAFTVAHAGVTCSAVERARQVFGELFGFALLREFDVDERLAQGLFGLPGSVHVVVYDGGAAAVEVFIAPDRSGPMARYEHLCVAVPDVEAFVGRAEAFGFGVRRVRKGERDIIFIRDLDGNLYEIKSTG